MPKRQIQVGGRKEVRLAVVESSGLAQEQQRQVFTPEDAVYQRYSELISGYLEKVARWHAIFQEEQYIFHQQPFQPSEFNADIVTEELESRFEVVQTHEGLVIGITKGDLEDGRRPERVIHAEMKYDRTLPYKGTGGDPRPGGSRHLEMEF